jgi:hypothetical protein
LIEPRADGGTRGQNFLHNEGGNTIDSTLAISQKQQKREQIRSVDANIKHMDNVKKRTNNCNAAKAVCAAGDSNRATSVRYR